MVSAVEGDRRKKERGSKNLDPKNRKAYGVRNCFNLFIMRCNREEFLLLIRQPAM